MTSKFKPESSGLAETTNLQRLLGSEIGKLAARRIGKGKKLPKDRIGKLVTLVEHASFQEVCEAMPAIEKMVLMVPFIEMLPVIAAIEKQHPSLAEKMPLVNERLRHLRKAADIAELFDRRKLTRLERALAEYQGDFI